MKLLAKIKKIRIRSFITLEEADVFVERQIARHRRYNVRKTLRGVPVVTM